MGKIFPSVIRLKEKPSLRIRTLALIEKSFGYQPPFKYETDFAPLMHEKNAENSFVLVNESEEVIAHIGARIKSLSVGDRKIPFCMLGGIAVDENHRGEGHFQTLLQEVLSEHRSDVAFFLLWSDQEALYKKFGFFLCGDQFEFDAIKNTNSSFRMKSMNEVTPEEWRLIKDLYQTSFKKTYHAPERSTDDWNILKEMKDVEVYLNEDSYFFKNKGQDLQGVIHEHGSRKNLTDVLPMMRQHGKVWSALPLSETETQQYQFFFSPGDLKLVKDFVSAVTLSEISLRDLNVMKGEAYFDFNGETLALEIEDFFRGILGPGAFEELGEGWKPIFIPGIDSI